MSFGEDGEGHSMYRDQKQKKHGNQQWKVWDEDMASIGLLLFWPWRGFRPGEILEQASSGLGKMVTGLTKFSFRMFCLGEVC